MNPVELQRLEELVDEARLLRQRLHHLTVMYERVLEMHGPQSKNICKSLRIEMRKGDCELRFDDLSNCSREHNIKVSVQDGMGIVEAVLAWLTKQQETLQKQLEELKL